MWYKRGIQIANKELGRWEHQVSAGDGALLIVYIKVLLLYYNYFPNKLCFLAVIAVSFLFPLSGFTSFIVVKVRTGHLLAGGRGSLDWEEIGKEEPKETRMRTGHELAMFCSLKNRSPAYLDMFIIIADSIQENN